MSVTRAQLSGGPAYAAYNNKIIAFAADSEVRTDLVTDVIDTALYGEVDEIERDFIVKATGTPLFYDTAQLTTLFPYLAPVIGTTYPTATTPCAWTSNNGDVINIASAMIGKMPDFTLGVEAPVMGAMEIWGVLPSGTDAGAANAYYSLQTGQSYANPPVPGTAVLGRQEFTANWGSVPGFAPFQAQDKWTVSHELKLGPVISQGRTCGFKIISYRAMAKCKPLGPSMAQIDAALYAQGTGAGGGYRLSANAANLVITGSNSMTVTVGNAALKRAGYVFAGQQLRVGELGWVSTLPIAAGGNPAQAALTLA